MADRLLELGVELAHITICGDRAADIKPSSGFSPTRASTSSSPPAVWDRPPMIRLSRPSHASAAGSWFSTTSWRSKIAAILRSFMKRVPDLDFDGLLAAKPQAGDDSGGADVIDPVGTAPGVVVPGAPTIPSSFLARRVSCRPCG